MDDSAHKAKTQLSKSFAAVAPGEEAIITSGRAKKRIAEVSRVEEPKLPRIGFAEHWSELGPEFFDPLPEDELRLWNGEGD